LLPDEYGHKSPGIVRRSPLAVTNRRTLVTAPQGSGIFRFMSLTGEMDPLEVLRVLTTRLYPNPPRAVPIDDAPPGFLAEETGFVTPGTAGLLEGDPRPRATLNGYALPPGTEKGSIVRVLGTLSPAGTLDAEGRSLPASPEGPVPPGSPQPPGDGEPGVWRVETGAALLPETWAVLPPGQAVLVGSERIRVGNLPLRGHGMTRTGRGRGEDAIAAPTRLPCGTRLDGRLRAFLLASGASTVVIRPAFPVAFGTVGDELADLGVPPDAECGRAAVQDLVALTVEETIRRAGLAPVPFGILRDSPEEVRTAVLRARERKVDVLILVGGMGEGVTDRTVESIERLEAEMILEGRLFDSGCGILYAKVPDLDLIALTGRPLLAAAELDLFVTPALLSRQGAAAWRWDWSRMRWPVDGGARMPKNTGEPRSWKVLPAALSTTATGEGAGGPRVRAWTPETWLLPLSAGQEGWAVLPPAGSGDPRDEPEAYFCPLPT